MKIVWFNLPAHGHTNPTLKVVEEMVDKGHEVYYFSFDQFKEKIEKTGANYISCDGYDFEMDDKDNADRVGKDMAFAVELLVSSTLALDTMIFEQIDVIKPDLIVSDSVAYWGKLTALKYTIPYVSSTTTFAFNQHSSKYLKRGFMEIIKMLFSMPKVNKHIKRLQDKGYPVKGILDIVQNDNETHTIVYTSDLFQPYAETFSNKYRFIGPSIRDIEQPMIKTREKTIYISMGTVNKNQEFYQNCIRALKNTDYQVILSLGENHEEYSDVPNNIQIYEHVDQMAVLDIADVFITHCGMNSASEGLYYEVPLILYPQTPEQNAVALRTEELNAGIKLKDIKPHTILETIETVLSDQKYKGGARMISESFKSAGGVIEAREFLESIVEVSE
ncbi:MAG: glucosyltransferase [Erysipelothrix sp.]|nr:glucosyltransferase [Erysipelothrix sp.]